MPKHVLTTAEPGRPKGSVSPKTIAINIIFNIFEEFGQHEFRKQMKEMCMKNPVAYYLKFMEPIQPKDIKIAPSEGNEMSFEIKITPAESKLK